jgi:hypothetical protein
MTARFADWQRRGAEDVRLAEGEDWAWLTPAEVAAVRWWPLALDDPDRDCDECDEPATRLATVLENGIYMFCGSHDPGGHDHDPGGCTCGCPVEGCEPCGGQARKGSCPDAQQ